MLWKSLSFAAACLPFIFYLYTDQNVRTPFFLTWTQDPTRSMHVTWISPLDENKEKLFYRLRGEERWILEEASSEQMPLKMPYKIYHVELSDLSPETAYEFWIEKDRNLYFFQTLSDRSDAHYPFVVGGDMYCCSEKEFGETAEIATSLDPLFVAIGGDIAYAHEKKEKREALSTRKYRWVEWMELWSKYMLTKEGRAIPLLPTIGNHDVAGHFSQSTESSPIYYALFPFPGPSGCGVVDVSHCFSMVFLDSGHTHPIEGDQELWLAETLKERQDTPWTFAVYHVPAYPGRRDAEHPWSKKIRKYWCPKFDQYGLDIAFEHHDHTYKRTHPISGEKRDPKGTLYLGDGGWGVKNLRLPAKDNRWYLAKTAQKQYFLFIEVDQKQCFIKAIDHQGEVFDEVRLPY